MALSVFLLAAAFGAFAQSAQASFLKTGVSVFLESPIEDSDLEAERIKDAGSSFVLQWLRWDVVAPNTKPSSWNPTDPADPAYDWSSVDQKVISAHRAGLTPVFQIWGAPRWAQRCHPPASLYVLRAAPCDPAPAEVADFAKAASQRFSGDFEGLPRVKYWQVMNEPNLFVFFNPQFDRKGRPSSPDLYRNILEAAYPAIKSSHPDNVVISAGLAPNGVGTDSLSPLDFARRLFCLNRANKPKPSPNACDGGVKLDVFDMHPYTSGAPSRKARVEGNVQMGNLPELKTLLHAADRANRIDGIKSRTPLWITEMSWDSKPPDPGGVPMRILTRWTAEVLHRSWRAGVTTFFWYSLRDQLPGDMAWSDTTQSGLYFRGSSMLEDRPKRSLKAFRFPVTAYSRGKGASFWGRTPTSEPGQVKIQLNTGSGWRGIASASAGQGGVFRGFAKAKAASRKRGEVRAVFDGARSLPFSLKPVKNFFQPPFG